MDLLKSEKFVDIVCLLGPEKVPVKCHQLYLKAASIVFETMLTERWQQEDANSSNHETEAGPSAPFPEGNSVPNKRPKLICSTILEIELPDVEVTTFRKFLLFVYDQVNPHQHLTEEFSHADLIKLLFFSHRFLVDSLVKACQDLLSNQITVPDAIQTYEAASLLDIHSLKEKTEAYITAEFLKIIVDPSFLSVSMQFLLHFLGKDELFVNELLLFHAVIRWAELQCVEQNMEITGESVRQILGEAIFQIRFTTLSTVEFAQDIDVRKVLTAQEQLDILRYICLTKEKIPTPSLAFRDRFRWGSLSTLCFHNYCPKLRGRFIFPALEEPVMYSVPFMCNGSQAFNKFSVSHEIALYCIGFMGPLDGDSYYDVKLEIAKEGSGKSIGTLKTRVFAKHNETFYVSFDPPIIVEPGANYFVNFGLKGFSTACPAVLDPHNELRIVVDGVRFECLLYRNPMTAVRFKKC